MPEPEQPEGTADRIKVLLFGKPRELKDPRIFHRLALVAFLAWVGLGADGLSSSAYGPEEAFKALGDHRWLALLLALATAVTVFIISWGESRIIEAFPSGGGGYVVSFKILGPIAGAIAGSALLIDMVLTIAISIASGVDAIFSYIPDQLHLKLWVAAIVIVALTVINFRGVKESVTLLAPVFIVFIATHAVVIGAAIVSNIAEVPHLVSETTERASTGVATIGVGGLLLIFLRAYSMGGGTYTGIEAVANGMNIMREPVVQTAKRTLLYMSISLAITAAGILIAYLLMDVHHVEGRTMNAVMVDRVVGGWNIGGVRVGHWLAVTTLASEAALLFVAAQAGFIAGPRVMASMAVDSWLPHRFAALSDRLQMRNGIELMAGAALIVLWYTGGSVSKLVVLYSINVFLTFTLSNTAMLWRAIRSRARNERWRKDVVTHTLAGGLCASILVVVIFEKFTEGGWVTLIVTGVVFAMCILIKRHYAQVRFRLRRLEVALADLPPSGHEAPKIDALQPTAVLLVGQFGGLGVHSLLSIFRFFPGYFKNVIFVSIGVVDSGNFKGADELEALSVSTERGVQRYVELATRLGIAADGVTRIGTDAVDEAEKVCDELAQKYPKHMFFGGKLVFHKERWFERFLHNETAYAIQRRLQWKGHPMTVLPVRVLE